MEAIFFLVPVSICIVFIALGAFIWSVNARQFEDLDKESYRILLDEDNPSANDSAINDPSIKESDEPLTTPDGDEPWDT